MHPLQHPPQLLRTFQQSALLAGMTWLPPFIMHNVLPPGITGFRIESPRSGEPEPDGLPRYILFYQIPDRAVSAARADAKRAVELHPGPRVPWPERIVSGCQRIDNCSDSIRARLQLAFVNVQYLHDASLGDAQRCW
jgi:hypothetical protein